MNIFVPSTTIPAEMRRREAARARIAYGQVFSRLLEDTETVSFRVISGHLWVTQENSRDDLLMSAGDAMAFTGPGRLVAEGIEDGAVVELG
ncbi:DUF2917 domain-containing protein [Luteolibacter sp. Populi]|uniref:DUF2917 domain-containing protein n=1 Tax=Luteolibacter sp. Populi TaxID=3230487 RepID=UPI00346521CD